MEIEQLAIEPTGDAAPAWTAPPRASASTWTTSRARSTCCSRLISQQPARRHRGGAVAGHRRVHRLPRAWRGVGPRPGDASSSSSRPLCSTSRPPGCCRPATWRTRRTSRCWRRATCCSPGCCSTAPTSWRPHTCASWSAAQAPPARALGRAWSRAFARPAAGRAARPQPGAVRRVRRASRCARGRCPSVATEHLHAPRVSVAEHMAILRERLRRHGAATFRSLVADCATTLEVVARFLGAARALPRRRRRVRPGRRAERTAGPVDRQPRRAGAVWWRHRRQVRHMRLPDESTRRNRRALSRRPRRNAASRFRGDREGRPMTGPTDDAELDGPARGGSFRRRRPDQCRGARRRGAGAADRGARDAGQAARRLRRARRRDRTARRRRRRADLHPPGPCARQSSRFLQLGQRHRLTQAALETLAVIAYRQPVTRARVSAIRGVNVDAVVRTLLSRGLIVEVGTEPDTGGGLFRTTELFLERMGMQSLAELPSLAPLLPDVDALEASEA